MKANKFGVLVEEGVETSTALIPWHAIEGITAYKEKVCISLREHGLWVKVENPDEFVRSLFEYMGVLGRGE